jgi:ribosomal protein L7/L12
MSITSEAKQEVARLLTAGQKNEAITYIQETFQISLIDAKALVEVVEKELNTIGPTFNTPTSDVPQPPITLDTRVETDLNIDTIGEPLKEEVKRLIIDGKKIEAVKLVKEQFGKGLKEALEMVDQVQKEIDPSLIPASSKSGCTKNLLRGIAVLFGIAAFVMIVLSALAWWAIDDQVSRSDHIKGKVVNLNQTTDGMYAPVISYEWKGAAKEYTSTFSSNPPDYSIGDEIYVLVDRENEDNIMLDTFTDRWLGLLIFAGIGLFFTFFTVMLAFAARRF